MPILHQPIIVKQPQWYDAVEAAIATGSARGVPHPPDLPPGGYLAVSFSFLRWRVQYRMKGRQVLLGSATEAGREQLRRRYLAKHPITLENGRQVVVTFDHDNPDLVRPIPIEVFRRLIPAALALLLAVLVALPAGAQEPPTRSMWLPIALRNASACDVAPRVAYIAVEEPGVMYSYTRLAGCPWSQVMQQITYLDENGQTHSTYNLPVEEGQRYYLPRWQVWREEGPSVVRMNVHIRITGQNYTTESEIGSPY